MAVVTVPQETSSAPTRAAACTLVGCPGDVARGVPRTSTDAGPSAAFVRVAITRTVYSVPAVRLESVWLVVPAVA